MSAPLTRWLVACRRSNLASLDLSTGGVFARSTEGSRITGAFTDGSSAFMDWPAIDVRRIENLGDGNGPGLLIEGARTNHVSNSRDVSAGGWVAPGVATITLNQVPGPDGTANIGDQATYATPDYYGNYVYAAGAHTAGGWFTCSTFVRRKAGSGQAEVGTSDGTSNSTCPVVTLTTTYQRLSHSRTGVTGNAYIIPIDGRGPPFGDTAHAIDHCCDLSQIEAGAFPSSAIRTSGSTVTRSPDSLYYTTGNFPSVFLTNGAVIEFAPKFSSADVIGTGGYVTYVLLSNGSIGANQLCAIYESGGSCYVYCQGPGSFVQRAITFSRNQKLTITFKPSAGSLTVAGATTGNGTTSGTIGAWSSGQTLYVGGDSGGTLYTYGRFLGGSGGLIVEAS